MEFQLYKWYANPYSNICCAAMTANSQPIVPGKKLPFFSQLIATSSRRKNVDSVKEADRHTNRQKN